MLSGLIDITSGDALILNNNVKTEPNKARQCMGVCPQKVRWDFVVEHSFIVPFSNVFALFVLFGGSVDHKTTGCFVPIAYSGRTFTNVCQIERC